MANLWEVVQEISSATRHIRELREELHAFKSDIEPRLRTLEVEVAALKEARATMRETVRAEITAAVAELRVRYAEEQLQRRRGKPSLPRGEEKKKP